MLEANVRGLFSLQELRSAYLMKVKKLHPANNPNICAKISP